LEVVAEKKDFGNIRSMFEKNHGPPPPPPLSPTMAGVSAAPMNPADLPTLKVPEPVEKEKPQLTSKGSVGSSKQDEANRRRVFTESTGKVIWMSDSDSENCNVCDAEFSMFNRRHHCRQCGLLICNDCSIMNGSLRVCYHCDENTKSNAATTAKMRSSASATPAAAPKSTR
jgi:hypothetical protein